MEHRHSQLTASNTQPSRLRAFIMLWMMLLAAGAAILLKPTQRLADQQAQIDLETMIPKQFGAWKEDDSLVPLLVSPDRQAMINKIYSQTLARTYSNGEGKRIMLSIAYGSNQSDSMQVHKPEVCYPAQGFQILKMATGIFDTGYGTVPVKRLLAVQGTRVEPVIYWIIIGDTMAINGLQWKLAQLKYGLTGKVPDGLIFRVSSIGDEVNVYRLQEYFVEALLTALSPEFRKRLIGRTTL